MSTFDYIQSALVTKSDKFYHDKLTIKEFALLLTDAIEALNKLDSVKKALFYNKPYYPLMPVNSHYLDLVVNSIASVLSDNQLNFTDDHKHKAIDVIHGLLGKATEAGEGLEHLLDVCNGKKFDPINAKEETFDGQWYDAILCNALSISFEEGQRNNIAKLKARFPDKFSEHSANNRDLDVERKVLEGETLTVTKMPDGWKPIHKDCL